MRPGLFQLDIESEIKAKGKSSKSWVYLYLADKITTCRSPELKAEILQEIKTSVASGDHFWDVGLKEIAIAHWAHAGKEYKTLLETWSR